MISVSDPAAFVDPVGEGVRSAPSKDAEPRPRSPFFVAAAHGIRVVVWDHGGSFSVSEVKLHRLVLKTITEELAGRRFDSIATIERAVVRAVGI